MPRRGPIEPRGHPLSHFEYISVAVSLVYSLILAKLLGALPVAMRRDRSYWVHTLWIVNLILAALSSWWRIWGFHEVEWNPAAFFALLTFPSIIYLRATILLGDEPRAVSSWREHYYESRRSFFILQFVGAMNFAVSPWLISGAPQSPRLLLGAAVGAGTAVLAGVSASRRVHEAVALVMLLAFASAPFAPL